MEPKIKEYCVWYTNGIGTSRELVRATSTYDALGKIENILDEHEEALGVMELTEGMKKLLFQKD